MTDCGVLPNITNGNVKAVAGVEGPSSYNATATYHCDSGYYLSQTVTRTCEVTGTWSHTQASCIAGIPVLDSLTCTHYNNCFHEK